MIPASTLRTVLFEDTLLRTGKGLKDETIIFQALCDLSSLCNASLAEDMPL